MLTEADWTELAEVTCVLVAALLIVRRMKKEAGDVDRGSTAHDQLRKDCAVAVSMLFQSAGKPIGSGNAEVVACAELGNAEVKKVDH